ncbi:MAG: M10 family metallopeptidase C-terminal domain-containing protein [Rhodoferax sp.]|nr:M10 family metallopeptidase C-terminal domain-containing protein [Rhodoferax sp.]
MPAPPLATATYQRGGSTTVPFQPQDEVLYFEAGSAAQLMFAVDGADLLVGLGTADFRLVGVAPDALIASSLAFADDSQFRPGDAGPNFLFGAFGNDYLSGGAGADTLQGEAADDLLLGGSGNDLLEGGTGNDTLDGGSGQDTLDGGDGDDLYRIDSLTSFVQDSGGADSAVVSVSHAKLPGFIEQVSYTGGAQPLPYWIDALLPDGAAGLRYVTLLGGQRTMAFSFPQALPAYNTSADDARQYLGFNAAQQDFARQALAAIAQVIHLQFTETGTATAANTIAFGNNQQSGSLAYTYYPDTAFTGSDVFLDRGTPGNLAPDAHGAEALTLIHELGHALGLDHPFSGGGDAPHLGALEDDTAWTVMSYNEHPAQYRLAYSPLDIAALQYLYGPSPASRAGNDTYVLDATAPNFLWDGAGIDTLDASAQALPLHLSLEPGDWSFIGSQAARITAPGQVTVNFGTVIEHLRGGSGDDALTGNASANHIQGGAGQDTLRGAAGADTLDGGQGTDVADFEAAPAAVMAELWRGAALQDGQGGLDLLRGLEGLWGSAFDDVLAGSDASDDLLRGGTGADGLYGADGNDTLEGGSGHDTLAGGPGTDTADYRSAPAGVVAELWRGRAASDGWSGQDDLWNLENIEGSAFADLLAGTVGPNLLRGGNGADRLYGGLGDDSLAGGAGADTLVGGAGQDLFLLDTMPGTGQADLLADFAVADDTIVLSRDVFAAFGGSGSPASGQLRAGPGVSAAADADDFLLYDSSTGVLSYDADGQGSAAAPVVVAVIGVGVALSVLDFVMG